MSRIVYTLKDKKLIARARRQTNMFGQTFCNKCHQAYPLTNLEVDHIKPISRGGKDNISNLQLLCSHCNRKKSNTISHTPKPNSTSPFAQYDKFADSLLKG